MRKIYFTTFTIALICSGFISCNNTKDKSTVEQKAIEIEYIRDRSLSINDNINYDGYIPEEGFVSTPEIAIKIAESILIPIYGKEKIEEQKPFLINLENDIWIIEGNSHEIIEGGTAYIEIDKISGKILKVFHSK